MGQPEAAREPSMDEILASIRKIIAEEPIGSRPVPAAQTKTAVANGEAKARPFAGSARQPAAPFGLAKEEELPGAAAGDPLFGRLAAALSGGVGDAPAASSRERGGGMFAEEATSATASADMTERPDVEKARSEPMASIPIADDLDDLLADDPINPKPAESRATAHSNIDFGQVVPADEKVEAAGGQEPSLAASTAAKPSTHAIAFEKMLSNRMATGRAEPVASEPLPDGPVVIASMAETGDSDTDASIEIADAETSEEAMSAFGALMAGLEASAPIGEPPRDVKAGAENAEATSPAVDNEADSGHAPAANEPPAAAADVGGPPNVVEAHVELPKVPVPAVLLAGEARSASGDVPVAAAVPLPAVPAIAAVAGLAATLTPTGGGPTGVRTVEDIVAELLRPMLREWLAENMPRMVEKALRIELADGLKTISGQPVDPKANDR